MYDQPTNQTNTTNQTQPGAPHPETGGAHLASVWAVSMNSVLLHRDGVPSAGKG